jgi:DNA-binding NarL/FixJ family response regulator
MIQSASSSTAPGIFHPPVPEETAFRSWISRRDAARQQIRRLSRRELQVVQLVADGLANKTIAIELQISVKTIEKHRANAARKLGVNSTAEMVRIAVQADHEARERRQTASPSYMGSQTSVLAGR